MSVLGPVGLTVQPCSPVRPAHLAHYDAGVYKCGLGAPCLPQAPGARPGKGSLLHETAGKQGADYRLGLSRSPGLVRGPREVAVPSRLSLAVQSVRRVQEAELE